MTSDDRADALRRSIGPRLFMCNEDELRVIDQILGRLELGRHRYGPLDLSKVRDWEHEEGEELLDAQVYRACAAIVERDKRLAAIEAAR